MEFLLYKIALKNHKIYQNMTVLENVMIGRHCRTSSFIFGAIMRTAHNRAEEEHIVEMSWQILPDTVTQKMISDLNSEERALGSQVSTIKPVIV